MISSEWVEYIVVAVFIVVMSVAYGFFENWLTKKLGMRRRSPFVHIADLEKDPGPLDAPEKLRSALVSSNLTASKHVDRIQDAFSRLLEENEVATLAIRSQHRELEWLGYQFGAARSTATDEESQKLLDQQLDELMDKYCAHQKWDIDTLASKVSVLARITPDLVDTEMVMNVFRVDHITASKAIGMSAENDAKRIINARHE